MTDPDRIEERLAALLVAERKALRKGALHDLAAMVEEKAMLVERMSQLKISSAGKKRLRALAEESLRHLAAALRGIESARNRIVSATRAARSLDTYDRLGQAQAIETGSRAVERRS